jgi:hypothetical protein
MIYSVIFIEYASPDDEICIYANRRAIGGGDVMGSRQLVIVHANAARFLNAVPLQ